MIKLDSMDILKNIKDIFLTIIIDAFNWLKPFLNQYGIILLILFMEFFLIRVYEFIYLGCQFKFLTIQITGIYYDFIFIALMSLIFFIPFSILYQLSKQITQFLFYIINAILIFLFIVLIDYLKLTSTPLDHSVFAYPLNELVYIATESVVFKFWDFSRYLITITIGSLIAFIVYRKTVFNKSFIFGLLFILSGIFFTKNLNPARRDFSNDISFNLTINKLAYFSKSCANHFLGTPDISALDFNKIVSRFQKVNPSIPFSSQKYPLEHTPDSTDLLGSYFNLENEPPNLVFIIMESLSSAFCGSNAYLGRFTPFIDSLINKSLYWENFLSTSERTFNAIPSIFGSLPYGEKGFMNLIQPEYKVNHSTLIKWLNSNNYETNFFYGGWTGFDNMEEFVKYQEIDFILKKFDDKYSKIEKDENGVSWGYPDKSLYMQSFEVLDSIKKSPRLDIYMTLSLHHPFQPPNKDYYHQRFLKRMDELGMDEKQKKETMNYSEIFSTVIYTDDAIRYFLNEYEKRGDYENTIFIITGDHRIGSQNAKSKIDKYHVPFIIFSPMLKQSVHFSSISTHLNVAPTFYSFLSANFGFELPEKVSWLGKQIDFDRNFRNLNNIPLMRTSREITDYVFGDYFLSENELFLIKENLDLKQIKNQKLLDSLTESLTNFIKLNDYITKNNLIISDEN